MCPLTCHVKSGEPWVLGLVFSPISHCVYNASSQSSLRHRVPGFSEKLPRPFHYLWPPSQKCEGRIAWHPTLKSAAICALVEDGKSAALHLSNAKEDCPLITWSAEELAGILQESSFKALPALPGPQMAKSWQL